ncbi:TIGR03915 family putative DNA repair protein [Desulfogranum japonicum]|uniref:TIGR03915 family putative DNA repair protein n=1 Tax=Desulfogranum japonicum TaxID=231447 RepID=UPI000400B6E6|nr:TIGR03915 family putative DNA repair protein [Desulfogranum japonicum]
MSRKVYLYDGSLEGLLHSVAAAVKQGTAVQGIYSQRTYMPTLFDTVVNVITDADQADRLLKYLYKLHFTAAQFAINGFFSEHREIGLHLYNFVLLCLRVGPDAIQLHSDDSVRQLHALNRKVSFEAHRLAGLIRFRILADELQYAPFESDHNVLGYCAKHFRKRLATRKWIIHDVGRDIALYWDKEDLHPVNIDREFTSQVGIHGEIAGMELTEQERYYQTLWRNFHDSISNPDRQNKQLQRSLMPKRYWKYLPEMK